MLHIEASSFINHHGNTSAHKVILYPEQFRDGTSTIEVLKLFISQDLISCLSLSSHWSELVLCVIEAFASDALTVAELTEE